MKINPQNTSKESYRLVEQFPDEWLAFCERYAQDVAGSGQSSGGVENIPETTSKTASAKTSVTKSARKSETTPEIMSASIPEILASITEKIDADRERGATIYPACESVFAALEATPPAKSSVVILGQDPYHQPGQANGLAFAVPQGVPHPPSLKNIFKELWSEYPETDTMPDAQILNSRAKQGVVLLNTVLTVRESEAGSHRGWGREYITDSVINALARADQPVVFILRGNDAQSKRSLIQGPRNHTIVGPHPSPLSARRGFLGSKPFSRTNQRLKEQGADPIKRL